MVEEAALEIGFPFDEGCTEYVESMIMLNHNINLNDERVVTVNLMKIITEEVESWKMNTELYF